MRSADQICQESFHKVGDKDNQVARAPLDADSLHWKPDTMSLNLSSDWSRQWCKIFHQLGSLIKTTLRLCLFAVDYSIIQKVRLL